MLRIESGSKDLLDFEQIWGLSNALTADPLWRSPFGEPHEPHEPQEPHEPHEPHEAHEAHEAHIVSIQHASAPRYFENPKVASNTPNPVTRKQFWAISGIPIL